LILDEELANVSQAYLRDSKTLYPGSLG